MSYYCCTRVDTSYATVVGMTTGKLTLRTRDLIKLSVKSTQEVGSFSAAVSVVLFEDRHAESTLANGGSAHRARSTSMQRGIKKQHSFVFTAPLLTPTSYEHNAGLVGRGAQSTWLSWLKTLKACSYSFLESAVFCPRPSPS